MLTYAYSGELVVIECCNCHMDFGMTRDFYNRARNNRDLWWYCPAGHSQHFNGTTDRERINRLRDELQSTKEETERVERRRRAQVAVNTKLKKRLAAGKCPACTITFEDLTVHMAEMHPGFAEAQEAHA